ncbi:MAG: S-methyl-5'-thioinosine phosphorylase [Ectothiorhodospiraceae bacterium AqS1]|nr:S-methyl-5'-thioinosine phosphorylase [Ectothiorhodospiraceae bacterium AqS1]
MSDIAIIGGTGLGALEGFSILRKEEVETPWGSPSAPLCHGEFQGESRAPGSEYGIVFLARHGDPHAIPPHRINYRANIHALHRCGVRRIVAVTAVGGIRPDIGEASIVIPDQIIDYTWGRGHSFFDGESDPALMHADFTHPYCPDLRAALLKAARRRGIEVVDGGTYAATQGPRLETAAEVDRIERDGGDIVGMTGMPEAALAREIGIAYANCSVIANRAAGRGSDDLSMEAIMVHLESGMIAVRRLLQAFFAAEREKKE